MRHFGMEFDVFQLDTVVGARSSATATETVPPSASMISDTVRMARCYDNRIIKASGVTISAVSRLRGAEHEFPMLSTDELLRAARVKAKSQAEIGRLLDLPSSRTTELFQGKRSLTYEEGRKLIEQYNLDGPVSALPNERALASILFAMGPSIPSGGMTEKAAESLAVALLNVLGLLRETSPIHPSDRDIARAVHAAALQSALRAPEA